MLIQRHSPRRPEHAAHARSRAWSSLRHTLTAGSRPHWQGKALRGARSELEQATQQKVAALMQLSDAQMSGGRAEDRADRASRQAEALRAQLEQVRGQVRAGVRV